MESFYKIKKEWDKEHKEYMAKLKKVYEGSKEAYIVEEDKAKKLVSDLSLKIKGLYAQSTSKTAQIDQVDAEIEDLNAKKIKAEQDYNGKRGLVETENTNIKKAWEEVEDAKKALADKEKANGEVHANNQKELEKLKADAEYEIGKNKTILKMITNTKDETEQDKNIIIEQQAELKGKQDDFRDIVKKHNEENAKFKADVSRINLNKEELAKKEREFNSKQALQAKKDTEQRETEQKQNDRKIEQDLRDAEFNSERKRIDNLIEIHKLNKDGKTV